MAEQELKALKRKFYEVVGSLSIEEIMSNPPLVERIKTLTSLLVAMTG